jgi:hypothetical protein
MCTEKIEIYHKYKKNELDTKIKKIKDENYILTERLKYLKNIQ